MRYSRVIAAVLVAGQLTGCASIISGTMDDVKIDSKPQGAACTVYRAGETVGRVVTPQTIPVERGDHTLLVTCEKDGQKGQVKEPAGLNGWFLGNLIFFPIGTIIGMAIDLGSGAGYGWDDPTVNLKNGGKGK